MRYSHLVIGLKLELITMPGGHINNILPLPIGPPKQEGIGRPPVQGRGLKNRGLLPGKECTKATGCSASWILSRAWSAGSDKTSSLFCRNTIALDGGKYCYDHLAYRSWYTLLYKKV